MITVESLDQDISPLEEIIKGGGKDTGLFGMWVFFKRCRSVLNTVIFHIHSLYK